MTSETTCYMCDALKTSVEHVPPRCLFPKAKDSLRGMNLRKELITVPACDQHNMDKSHDDEYLMYALVLGILNNATASQQVHTKIQRAIRDRPAVARLLSQHPVSVRLEEIDTGSQHDAVALRVDNQRVHRALEHIGRALYFHHFKQKWLGDVQAIPLFLIALEGDDPKRFNDTLDRMRVGVEALVADTAVHGANPDVFTYQVQRVGQTIECVMLLRFYEGSKTVLIFRPFKNDDPASQNDGAVLSN